MLIERQQSGKGVGQARLRVLIVEDHRDTAEVTCKLLHAHGFDARFAGSHREALQAASEWVPDVLICDIGLPGKDGLDVMKTMRTAYPGLKGVVVSGYARPEDKERSLAAGFAEHLSKPIEINRLVRAIRGLF